MLPHYELEYIKLKKELEGASREQLLTHCLELIRLNYGYREAIADLARHELPYMYPPQ